MKVAMRSIRQYRAAIAGAAFLVLAFLGTSLAPNAFASSSIGPVSEWFGGIDTVRYTLEQDSNVTGAANLVIPIYVLNGDPNTAPTITVKAYDSASGFSGTLAPACINTANNCSSGSCTINCSLTVPSTKFVYDKTINGWRAYVYARLKNGSGIHQFRLSAPGATVGYYSTTGRSFAVAHDYNSGNLYNYSIPFGTDCSVETAQSVNVKIFDGDVGNNGIQPLPFVVRVVDVTTNTRLVDKTYTTQAQANAAGLGNNGTATYSFTAVRNHDYKFQLFYVYSHNTLQFRLPYSSIYSQVDCNYNLVPTTSVDPTNSEANTDFTATPVVNNTGAIGSVDTHWEVSRFVVPVGQTVPSSAINNQTPASYYGFPSTFITKDQGDHRVFPIDTTTIGSYDDNTGPYPVGTKICYALSVVAYSDTDSSWSHGTPGCVTVTKKPKAQIWGGDLAAGATFGGAPVSADVSTSLSRQATATYGSWVEYGASASGTVKNLGSGSAYNGGLAVYDRCNVSQLIFTSAGTGTCSGSTVFGNYTSVQSIPDVGAAFPVVSGTTPTFNNLGDTALRRVETAIGTVTVGGGTVNVGDWLVLNAPTATVNITGDITYTGAKLRTLADIPQVIIVANCINIAGNVTNVDAWLIAVGKNGTNSGCSGVADGGVLNTCGDVAAGGNLSSSICSNPLRVNGPVMARHLYAQRTAGSGPLTAAGDPAEVFNLRPDAYLWLAQRSIASGYVQAVQTTELPPRF